MRRNVSHKSPMVIIRSCQIGMLQVDLDHHSDLSNAMAPGLVMEAKMQLARDLEHHLLTKRVKCLTWAGDGGIFWIECVRENDFDAVALAGEVVFRVVNSVNALYADRFPAGQKMILRVSAHFGSVLTVPEPRFWHSRELNFFAKHERELSAPGMFGITKQLRDMLSQEQREKFPEAFRITKDIAGQAVPIYFHQSYGGAARAEGGTRGTVSRKSAMVQRQAPAFRERSG
jgi:hypothetical protein